MTNSYVEGTSLPSARLSPSKVRQPLFPSQSILLLLPLLSHLPSLGQNRFCCLNKMDLKLVLCVVRIFGFIVNACSRTVNR